MTNTTSQAQISETARALFGEPLSDEITSSFEQASADFLERKRKQQVDMEILDEIAKLLTITEKDLESVKGQKWFERAWKTVTRSNKKLEKKSQANLMKVQVGAVAFMQNLAETDALLMDIVASTLQRIEDIHIGNVKLQGYIVHIVRKYNDHLDQLDSRLSAHDEAISNLLGSRKRITWFLLCIILLGLSIPAYLYLPNAYQLPVSIACVLTSVAFFFVSRQNVTKEGITRAVDTPDRTTFEKENEVLLPEIRNRLRNKYNTLVEDELLYTPIATFAESNGELNELYALLSDENIDGSKLSAVVHEIINVDTVTISAIKRVIVDCADRFCTHHQNTIRQIHQTHLSDIIGLDVLASLGQGFRSDLVEEIFDAYDPYENQFKDIISTRNSLQEGYKRFADLLSESVWKTAGKALASGLTFYLYDPLSDDDDDKNQYINLLIQYGQQWDSLASIIGDALMKLNWRSYESAIDRALIHAAPLFEAFNQHNVSLRLLYDQLEMTKEDQ